MQNILRSLHKEGATSIYNQITSRTINILKLNGALNGYFKTPLLFISIVAISQLDVKNFTTNIVENEKVTSVCRFHNFDTIFSNFEIILKIMHLLVYASPKLGSIPIKTKYIDMNRSIGKKNQMESYVSYSTPLSLFCSYTVPFSNLQNIFNNNNSINYNNNNNNNNKEHEESISKFTDLFLLKAVKVLTHFCPPALTIANEEGLYPLHSACFKGSIDVVKFLFENYAFATTLQDSKHNLFPFNILLHRFNTENENFVIENLNLKFFSIVKSRHIDNQSSSLVVDINKINKKRSCEKSNNLVEVENNKQSTGDKKKKLNIDKTYKNNNKSNNSTNKNALMEKKINTRSRKPEVFLTNATNSNNNSNKENYFETSDV
jgi:hypothetical protein